MEAFVKRIMVYVGKNVDLDAQDQVWIDESMHCVSLLLKLHGKTPSWFSAVQDGLAMVKAS
eukprot:5454354-Amphidinium_carterae.1